MPRQFKSEKPFIEVFCEGESEQGVCELSEKEVCRCCSNKLSEVNRN